MSNLNGLLPPSVTHSSPQNAYFARKLAPELTRPTLIAPITLQSVESEGVLAVPATITVPGPTHATPAYVGAVKITPGGNVAAENGSAGIVIRAAAGETPSIAASTILEVGTDGEAPNQVLIAGPEGLSEVYNELYNQPVALQPITLSATNPLCAPDPNNVGEIFRCEQAGVAASAVSAIGTNFVVPKTGWYALQTEVKLGNAPVPAAPTINVPITVAPGGVNFGETLSFSFADGVVTEPYGLMEVTSNEFVVSDILVANTITVRTYTSLHLFEAGNTYGFTLRASSGVWNIGDGGQIKCELIAMC
jgi:hypothetical protein